MHTATRKINRNGDIIGLSTRKIYILLTKFYGSGSRALTLFSGNYYTHASIGLDEDMNTFYSFVVKGFMIEKITRYLKPGREPFPVKLYEISVPEDVYYRIKHKIDFFVAYKSRMHYTMLGVILSVLCIPYQRKYTYFCSQFVAEVLKSVDIVPSHKNSALYLPGDLSTVPGVRLLFVGDMEALVYQFRLANESYVN